MIVECYTADVYCDDEEHPYAQPGCCSNPDVFIGTSKRATDAARRKAGWRKIAGNDICPKCVKRKLADRA